MLAGVNGGKSSDVMRRAISSAYVSAPLLSGGPHRLENHGAMLQAANEPVLHGSGSFRGHHEMRRNLVLADMVIRDRVART